MKKIITLLPVLLSFSLLAQDSLIMKVGPVKFRARDLETLYPLYKNSDDVGLQLLLDSVVSKYKTNPPNLADTVRIDSVERGAIIKIGLWVRSRDHELIDGSQNNIKAIISLIGDTYINNYFINHDAAVASRVTLNRQAHRLALRRKRE
jgi:hypothetical protein